MPLKVLPKVFQLSLKTERLTINLQAPQAATIASLKEDALSALTSQLSEDELSVSVSSVDDFELVREIKGKNRMPTGRYEVLGAKETVGQTLTPWEIIFVQYRDDQGKLRPVEVSIPTLLGDEAEEDEPISSNKGKRKAPQD